MRILILYPEVGVGVRWTELLSLGVTSAMLKHNGHEVDLLYYKHPAQLASLEKAVPEIKPGLVIAHIAWDQWRSASRLMREARNFAPDVLFVANGIYPSLDPDSLVDDPAVNALAIGETEPALTDLAQRLASGQNYVDLHGFWFKTSRGQVIKNPIRPLVENLASFPFADRTLYDHAALVRSEGGGLPMLAGRGCPHDCLFCYMPRMKQLCLGKGEFVRFRSPMNIVGETLQFVRRAKVDWVNFVDEYFPHDVPWLSEFCPTWKAQVGLPFRFTAISERLSLDSLQRLREAGCAGIRLGIETGNEKFRARIADRNLSNRRLQDLCDEARRLGIEIQTFNMVGLPLENPDLADETVRFSRSLPVQSTEISVYNPIPGTRLYEYCRDKGYISGVEDAEFNPRRARLRLPAISEEEVLRVYDEMRALNRELRLKEASPAPGYCDLAAASNSAKVQSECYPGLDVHFFACEGQKRLCLIQAIGSRVALPVALRERSVLAFGAALGPVPCGIPHRRPVQIEIAVRQGQMEETAFVKVLHPGESHPGRGWLDFQLPLFEWAAGPAEIVLTATLIGGTAPGTMCVAWSRPVLIEAQALGAAGAAQQGNEPAAVSSSGPPPARQEIIDLTADFDKAGVPPASAQEPWIAQPAAAIPAQPGADRGVVEVEARPVPTNMRDLRADLENKRLGAEIKGLKMELEQKARRVAELRLRELELVKEVKGLREEKAEWERLRAEMETSMGDKFKKFFKKG